MDDIPLKWRNLQIERIRGFTSSKENLCIPTFRLDAGCNGEQRLRRIFALNTQNHSSRIKAASGEPRERVTGNSQPTQER